MPFKKSSNTSSSDKPNRPRLRLLSLSRVLSRSKHLEIEHTTFDEARAHYPFDLVAPPTSRPSPAHHNNENEPISHNNGYLGRSVNALPSQSSGNGQPFQSVTASNHRPIQRTLPRKLPQQAQQPIGPPTARPILHRSTDDGSVESPNNTSLSSSRSHRETVVMELFPVPSSPPQAPLPSIPSDAPPIRTKSNRRRRHHGPLQSTPLDPAFPLPSPPPQRPLPSLPLDSTQNINRRHDHQPPVENHAGSFRGFQLLPPQQISRPLAEDGPLKSPTETSLSSSRSYRQELLMELFPFPSPPPQVSLPPLPSEAAPIQSRNHDRRQHRPLHSTPLESAFPFPSPSPQVPLPPLPSDATRKVDHGHHHQPLDSNRAGSSRGLELFQNVASPNHRPIVRTLRRSRPLQSYAVTLTRSAHRQDIQETLQDRQPPPQVPFPLYPADATPITDQGDRHRRLESTRAGPSDGFQLFQGVARPNHRPICRTLPRRQPPPPSSLN